MNTFNSPSEKPVTKHQVLYRIFTQDGGNYRNTIIDSLKARGIPDFTIVGPAIGYGSGQGGRQESTVVIEVAADDGLLTLRAIRGVVNDIHRNNVQQSVVVVAIPVAWVESREEKQLQLPVEEILKPQRKLKGRFAEKPRIVAHCGKWEMLLTVVRASVGEV